MSKRSAPSRSAKRQPTPAARRNEQPGPAAFPPSPTGPAVRPPGTRHRALLAIAAGALAAWLTLLTIVAFAT